LSSDLPVVALRTENSVRFENAEVTIIRGMMVAVVYRTCLATALHGDPVGDPLQIYAVRFSGHCAISKTTAMRRKIQAVEKHC
jgi:hypothetical protein